MTHRLLVIRAVLVQRARYGSPHGSQLQSPTAILPMLPLAQRLDPPVRLFSTPRLLMKNGHIAVTTFGEGRAGNIEVNVGSLDLQDGSIIDSSTDGEGRGGTVTVTATESISVSDSFIGSVLGSSGRAGKVILSAARLRLDDEGGILSATTEVGGRAGDIEINVDTLTIRNGARIVSTTFGTKPAGTVTVKAAAIDISGGRLSGIRSDATNLGGDCRPD